ncbi:hypothetical protein KM043_016559 [Ampulex compressa]|nr:hypothetical protein KM043_016559 [Ampulex compressa]
MSDISAKGVAGPIKGWQKMIFYSGRGSPPCSTITSRSDKYHLSNPACTSSIREQRNAALNPTAHRRPSSTLLRQPVIIFLESIIRQSGLRDIDEQEKRSACPILRDARKGQELNLSPGTPAIGPIRQMGSASTPALHFPSFVLSSSPPLPGTVLFLSAKGIEGFRGLFCPDTRHLSHMVTATVNVFSQSAVAFRGSSGV